MTTTDELSSSILSSFIEITGADIQTARHFLDVTIWNLNEAIRLFFIRGSQNQFLVPSFPYDNDSSWDDDINPPLMEENHQSNLSSSFDGVRAPLPVRRESLYGDEDDDLYGDEDDEKMELALAASKEESDSLGWMFPPPINMTFKGTFEKAKQVASMEEKWLLVNLQSKNEFSSHMLNRDTWSNEGVAQILKKNFIFWQVTDDTIEGTKFSTYYNLHGSTLPVVLLLDPVTGQKMCSWNGMIEGERLMEELVPFMDAGIKGKQPHFHHRHRQQQQPRESTDLQRTIVNQEEEKANELMLAIALLMEKTLANGNHVCPSTSTNTEMDEESPSLSESEKEEEVEEETCLMEEEKRSNTYPALPEEPKTVDRKLVCRVGFRLPQDGRRVQRCFLRTDPIQLLWSFIISQLDEAEVNRPFRLTVPHGGITRAASKALDYECKLSFEESGLSNSMVSVTWDD